MHRRHAVATLVLMCTTGLAAAATPADLSPLFGAREAVRGMQLSPDGSHLSYLAPLASGGNAVVVIDAATGKLTPVTRDSNANAHLEWCRWKSDKRLICELSGITDVGDRLLWFTRLIAIDPDGTNPKVLGQRSTLSTLGYNQSSGTIIDWLPDDPDHVMMAIDITPERSTGTRLARTGRGLSAQIVDVRNARSMIVENGKVEAAMLMTDGRGHVRIMGSVDATPDGYAGNIIRYSYRKKGASEWQPLLVSDMRSNAGTDLLTIDESGDWLYILAPHDGRQALFRLALNGSGDRQLVFAHPLVDVTGIKQIGKYRRPVAAEYSVESGELEYFDPKLKAFNAALSKTLPRQPIVSVLDESWNGDKRLIFAGSDVDPGRYYLYGSASHELNELLPVRAGLDKLRLAPVKPVSYLAHDGTRIPAYLTLPAGGANKNLPAIIMPHGGPSARDEWGFDWLPQYFAQLGYAVLQPNFRGSAGYGEAWYQRNGFRSWQAAIGDINDGARWLIAQGVANPKSLAIFGWSYGGYAALQANVLDPDLYKAAIAVAPVTSLAALKSESYRLTNYHLVTDFIGSGPHILAGSPASNAAAIKAPVLMFHGDRDLNVSVHQSQLMDDALRQAGKRHELVIYKGLDHQLDDGVARSDMLRRSGEFLYANFGH